MEQFLQIGHNRIRVLYSGSSNKAILFVHGNSCNADMWQNQLNDRRFMADFQLIAFDLPGCGKSDKSTNYSMQELGSLIPLVVKEMGVKNYIVVGISYGTCLIGEVAPRLPGCLGVMLVSPNITSNEYHPGTWLNPFPEAPAMASATVDVELLLAFAKMFVVDPSSTIVFEYMESYKNTDPEFRLAVGKTIMENRWTDEPNNILALNVPVCIVFGALEKILQVNYLNSFPNKWRERVFLIPGAAHFVNLEQPLAFNILLDEFASWVFSETK